MSKFTVIFILAAPKSGSTLLQILLSKNKSTFAIGERQIPSDKMNCSCGKNVKNCQFWSKIIEKNENKILNFFSPKTHLETYIFFNEINNLSSKNFIIDNSKNTIFLKNCLLNNNYFNLKIVGLIRNPIEIIDAQKKKRIIHDVKKGMSIFKTSKMIFGYTIAQILLYKKLSSIIFYKNLINSPLKEINYTLDKLSLDTVENLDVLKDDTHLIGGSGYRGNYNQVFSNINVKNLNKLEIIYSYILNIPTFILIGFLKILNKLQK